MKAANYIKNHVQFSQEDFTYLSNKGYSNKEIKAIWDREIGRNKPVTHNSDIKSAAKIYAIKNMLNL